MRIFHRTKSGYFFSSSRSLSSWPAFCFFKKTIIFESKFLMIPFRGRVQNHRVHQPANTSVGLVGIVDGADNNVLACMDKIGYFKINSHEDIRRRRGGLLAIDVDSDVIACPGEKQMEFLTQVFLAQLEVVPVPDGSSEQVQLLLTYRLAVGFQSYPSGQRKLWAVQPPYLPYTRVVGEGIPLVGELVDDPAAF